MKFHIKKFRLVNGANTLKATADLTLREAQTLPDGRMADINEIVTIHDVKLIAGRTSLFVSMPTLKRKERYYPVASLHDDNLEQEILEEMLRLYEASGGKQPDFSQTIEETPNEK